MTRNVPGRNSPEGDDGPHEAGSAAGRAAAKRTYVRSMLISVATIGLAVFVFWKEFTSPRAEGGMGASPSAVVALAVILVVIAGISCRMAYRRAIESEE